MYDIDAELKTLSRGLAELKLKPSDHILGKFETYLRVLYSYKARLHLISNKDYTRISVKHFLPALLTWQYLKNGCSACDIGAGAGFPSIPLKIVLSDIHFTLIESVRKRAIFLNYLKETLNLTDIEIVNSRAEEVQNRYFDFVLVRAAGKIKGLMKTISCLLKPDATAIFYKSASISKELQEAERVLGKYGFSLTAERVLTPVIHEPMTLVFLKRKEL